MDQIRILKKIANTLSITCQCVPNIGLLTGQMGIVIFLFEYSIYSNCNEYKELAEDLLEKILSKIHGKTPIYFAEGLSGIGWGLNYMIQENFIEADCDFLDEIDDIMRGNWRGEVYKDINEEIPLFSKGLYFLERGLKEDIVNTLYELESFLPSLNNETLSPIYLNSIRYFLVQLSYRKIEEEKSLYLLSKLPVYETALSYWETFLYRNEYAIPEGEEMRKIINQIDTSISDIHYQELSLYNGLTGLALLLFK